VQPNHSHFLLDWLLHVARVREAKGTITIGVVITAIIQTLSPIFLYISKIIDVFGTFVLDQIYIENASMMKVINGKHFVPLWNKNLMLMPVLAIDHHDPTTWHLNNGEPITHDRAPHAQVPPPDRHNLEDIYNLTIQQNMISVTPQK
jgi:hypothetical protein